MSLFAITKPSVGVMEHAAASATAPTSAPTVGVCRMLRFPRGYTYAA